LSAAKSSGPKRPKRSWLEDRRMKLSPDSLTLLEKSECYHLCANAVGVANRFIIKARREMANHQ